MGIFDLFKKKEGSTDGAITQYGSDNFKDLINNEDINGQITAEENVEQYVDEISNAQFLLVVEDVFTITGRGTVVTGKIMIGTIKVGEKVRLRRIKSGEEREVTITGIEMFRKLLQEANAGENVGVLLREVTRGEIARGDILYK